MVSEIRVKKTPLEGINNKDKTETPQFCHVSLTWTLQLGTLIPGDQKINMFEIAALENATTTEQNAKIVEKIFSSLVKHLN